MRKPARFFSFVAALGVCLAGLVVVGSGAPASAIADRDCGDFASQKAAQLFFLRQGGPRRDPHRLDSEGDGIACESNPAPYYYKKKLPGGGGSGGGGNGGGGSRPKVIREAAIVTKVIDGDTVRVKLTKSRTRKDVRLIGIDTPEVYGGTECYGPQASNAMKRILPRNTRVILTSDPTQNKKDRYGRLLRYITKKNGGLDVNRRQVFNGAARVYVYDKPFKQVREFRNAQADAKRAKRGLWGAC